MPARIRILAAGVGAPTSLVVVDIDVNLTSFGRPPVGNASPHGPREGDPRVPRRMPMTVVRAGAEASMKGEDAGDLPQHVGLDQRREPGAGWRLRQPA